MITIKLSNVLYHFDEFYNRCNLELSLTSIVQEQLETLYDEWKDLSKTGEFHIEQNKEFSIEILEFLLEEFQYFKSDVFDYTIDEVSSICPNLVVENYSKIYDKLIEVYDLEDDGLGNYTEWEIQRMNNTEEDVIEKTNIEIALEKLLIDQPIEFSKCYIITDVPKDTPQRICMEISTQEKKPVYLMNKIYDLIGIQFDVEVLQTSKGGWNIYIDEKELGVDERRELAQKIKEFVDKNSYFSCDTNIDELDISEDLVFSTRVNGDIYSEEFSQIDFQEAHDLKKKLLKQFTELKDENIEIDTAGEFVNVNINFNVIK